MGGGFPDGRWTREVWPGARGASGTAYVAHAIIVPRQSRSLAGVGISPPHPSYRTPAIHHEEGGLRQLCAQGDCVGLDSRSAPSLKPGVTPSSHSLYLGHTSDLQMYCGKH